MTNDEKINAAEDVLVRAAYAQGVDREVLNALHTFHQATRSMQECLRWMSGQVLSQKRGGIPESTLAAIASAAARGEDWKAKRDAALAARLKEKR